MLKFASEAPLKQSFPSQFGGLIFRGYDTAGEVRFGITTEALRKNAGDRQGDLVDLFVARRQDIERVARRRYQNTMRADPNELIIIRECDV